MPKRKQKGSRIQKGGNVFDDIGNWGRQAVKDTDAFLKKTKIASTIGSVALPAIGGLIGSLADPFIGPSGTAIGGVLGSYANDQLRNGGYGKKKGYGYLGGVPSPLFDGKSKFSNSQIMKVQGGGVGYTSVFGTVSSDRGRIGK